MLSIIARKLVASVTWQKAALDDKPDDVRTAFALAPVGRQVQSIAKWGAPAAVVAGPRSFAEMPLPVGQTTTAMAFGQDPVGAVWERFTKQPTPDHAVRLGAVHVIEVTVGPDAAGAVNAMVVAALEPFNDAVIVTV